MEKRLSGQFPVAGALGRRMINRRFVEAVLWIVRTSPPWRDLPPVFGNRKSVFRRFSR